MLANFWQLLNGEVPGGFLLPLVVAISFIVVWEFTYRVGQTLPQRTYRRWRWLGPVGILAIYALFWVQSPPRIAPLRLAVLVQNEGAADEWVSEGLADLTVRRLRRTLKGALVNPWEDAVNYRQPESQALLRAKYHVYLLQCYSSSGGITCKLTVPGGEKNAIFASSDEINWLAVSGQAAEWILNDLGKKRPLAGAFKVEYSASVLENFYRGRHQLFSDAVDSAGCDTALGFLGQALALDSTFIPAQLLSGRCLELRGDRDQAQDMLAYAARADGNSVEALLALGEFYLRGYEWDRAEPVLKVVLAQDPHQMRAALGLARLRPSTLKNLRLNSPEKLLQEAVRQDPAFELARIMYADQLCERGYPRSARKLLQRGLWINPDSEDLMLKLGAVEIDCGNLPNARAIYDSMLEANPSNAIVVFNLGVLDYREKKYAAAIDRFRLVQGLNGPIDYLYYLGLIYQQKGDKSRAKFYFKKRWEARSDEKDAFGLRAHEMYMKLEERPGG